MKKTNRQRWLSLLLALTVCLGLIPAAWAAEEEDDDPSSNPELVISTDMQVWERRQSGVIEANLEDRTIVWDSSNEEVATISNQGVVTPLNPGETVITAYYVASDGKTKVNSNQLLITVSGLVAEPVEVEENGRTPLSVTSYGNARYAGVRYAANENDNYVSVNKVSSDSYEVYGKNLGSSTVTATAAYGEKIYTVDIKVTVVANTTTRIPQDKEEKATLPLNSGEAKSFRSLESYFNTQLDGKVNYVTGLFVPTNQGTLYYNYMSESEPGSGVGQVETYYRSPGAGQRALNKVTFVPKPGYAGEATITYNAITTDDKTYSCKIVFTVQGASGPDGDGQASSMSVNTRYNTAVRFDSMEFGSVCRERLGVQLEYVVFAQPPERQGALYTNYSDSGSYGSLVNVHSQYGRKSIDDIWFVPAPGYLGEVTVYYTGYGTNGRSYPGQVLIRVGQEDSASTDGLLSYEVAPGAMRRFADNDFDVYCKAVLGDSDQEISGIRFESLPSERDGVLYYDYQTSTTTGSRAAAGTVYYSGTRTPRISRLAFVPSESFTGTLKLPFTGWTKDGTSFSGSVEINVRSGASSGDITYYCDPGKTVSFVASDFTGLSQRLTGSTLSYISFRTLPSDSEGSLYYSSTPVTTGSPYYSSTLSRLSFRASSKFTGPVYISFEGQTNLGTFTGVITIESTGSGINSGTIRYTTDWKTAVVFDQDDFDELSRWYTDQSIASVRFNSLPSSTSQGTLYRNYYSSSSMGTRLTTGASVSASGLNSVAFVPVSGYTGTIYLYVAGTAAGSGGTFTGTVEINVTSPPADATARYSTRTEAVQFYADDLARNGYTLSSIRFTALPPSSAGYLYYRYTSPIKYGQQVNTGTTYRTSGSNLISDLAFVPRAGYSGTVAIPYVGTNSNNTTFTGEVVITVAPSYNSAYFSDMANYSNAQRAAVDFLYAHNITSGLIVGQYGPENSIRRGDFALMLYKAFEMSSTVSTGAFSDVSSSAYYAEAVNALYSRGVVSGIGNGYYAPDSALTRQDAICMVQRAMRAVGWNASDGSANAFSGYSDGGSVSGYAQGAMALAVQRGYLPTSGGMLNPKQSLTRVDMAEIIHRVLTY